MDRKAVETIAQNAVTTAKTRLILKKESSAVFFASLAMRTEFKADWTIDTAATDGRKIIYNPEFVSKLRESEVIGLLAHEILHIVGKHFARRCERDLAEWNIACDLAINPILRDAGYDLPGCGLMPGRTPYESIEPGKSAEEYFTLLQAMKPENQPGDDSQDTNQQDGDEDTNGEQSAGDDSSDDTENQDGQNNGDGDDEQNGEQSGTGDDSQGSPGAGNGTSDPGQSGGVIDPQSASPAELAEIEAEVTVNVAAAQQAAERRGTLSAGLARICGEAIEPAVNWREQLREFINRPVRADYNWKRPNKRHIHRGLYLPSNRSQQIGHIVAAIDTSGSITDATLTRYASELADIADSGSIARISIVYHDSAVCRVDEWTPEDGALPGRLWRRRHRPPPGL